MDLFLRYGAIAAAGDRHLAEFCPGKWYLGGPEDVCNKWGFGLTPVSFRKQDLEHRNARRSRLLSGEEKFELKNTGEEGVLQIKAVLGLGDLVTNVNMPNVGQIPNLPLGAVVETNSYFTAGKVSPITAGKIPTNLMPLIFPIVSNQECIVEAALSRNLDLAFCTFIRDPLMTASLNDAEILFDKMIDNTSKYLTSYPQRGK